MRRVFNILQWGMLFAIIIGLIIFSYQSKQYVHCNQVTILIKQSKDEFINQNMIQELLVHQGKYPLHENIADIQITEIERIIKGHPSIKDANVYSDISGRIFIEINQRRPIARVVMDNNSFYLDEDGASMPISDTYTSRVMIISGNLKLEDKRKMYILARYIEKDPFWKAQITQIYMKENCKLILIPRVGNQEIVFGTVDNMDEKFHKLKLFYQNVMRGSDWQKYSKINLMYKNQIVCTKK